MKKDPIIFVKHILNSIKHIEKYSKNLDKKHFSSNALIQDGVIRRLEIIGEAAKNLPENFREKHKEIPWIDITDTRNKLIHHYFGIDLDITWDIIKRELPDLKKKIKDILKKDI